MAGHGLSVADVVLNRPDAAGVTITVVYAKRTPRYAVYRTRERVLVHFADDNAADTAQRAIMSRLNPLRGEINGLIDGWRISDKPRLRAIAERYDRRVADALTGALEDDPAGAEVILREIKKDVLDERTSWARFQYLIIASLAAVVVLSAIGFVTGSWFSRALYAFPKDTYDLWLAAGSGAVGAFFSIAIAIRNRTVLTDLRVRDNAADAILRIIIGVIAAVLLLCLLLSKAVNFSIGEATLDPKAAQPWLFVLIIGFIAGFSERMVPDLLAKSVTGMASTTPLPPLRTAPSIPGAEPAAPAPAAAVRTESRDDHADEHEREVDACLCDIDIHADDETPDTDLPPASGGVALARP